MLTPLVRRFRVERALSRGQTLLAAGQPNRAVQAFELGLSQMPESIPLRLHKALALSAASRHPEAHSEAQRATRAPSGSSALRCLAARVFLDTGDPTAAEAEARTALDRDPSNLVARGYLAAATIALGHIEQGIKILREEEVAEDPFLQARLILELEKTLRSRREPLETSPPAPKTASTLPPSSARARRTARRWLERGGAAFIQDRFDTALECYRKGLEAAPDEHDLHAYIAESLYWKSDYSGALAAIELRQAAMEKLPPTSDDHPLTGAIEAYLGAIHYHLENLEVATHHLERASQHPIDDPEYTLIKALVKVARSEDPCEAQVRAIGSIASTERQDPDYLDKKIDQLCKPFLPHE